MGVELFAGYLVAAALFYVTLAKRAPYMEEPQDVALAPSPAGQVIELFPEADAADRAA